MHNKHKLNNSPLLRQYRNVSPFDHKAKHKKAKEGNAKYPRTNKEPTPPPKMKQHMTSKSALETVQHLHYNSPTLPNTNPCSDRQTNPFTFTQLLQQSSQNISPLSLTAPFQHFQPSRSALQLKEGKEKDKSMARTPLTMTDFSPNVANHSQEYELAQQDMEFTQLLKHKLNNLSSQNKSIDKSAPKSIPKSNPKSPLRVSNMHRLNNTPKLKQKKPQEQEVKEDEVINLECSEKLCRFFIQSEEKGKKNKSNLLSTGIINLSQPFDNSESQVNRLSKETLPSKIKIERIISQENIKQFESQSPECFQAPTIHSIKAKLEGFNFQILKQLKAYNQHNFIEELSNSFNPELNSSSTSSTIKELQQIGSQFRDCFQNMIKQISYASRKVEEDIESYIERIRDSNKAKIDWVAMQHFCEEKEKLDLALCKNEVFSLRVQQLQDTGSQNSHQKTQNKLLQLETQITQQIKHLYNFLPSDPPQKQYLAALPSNFKLKLERFKSFLSSFQQIFSQ